MIYPYLLIKHPLYGDFPDYQTAIKWVRTASGEECELYVKKVWVHAYIYEHGREYTVVSMGWRDYKRIKEENPELDVPNSLSMTQMWSTYNSKWDSEKNIQVPLDIEEQIRRDTHMWRIAAATMIERDRTKELENHEPS